MRTQKKTPEARGGPPGVLLDSDAGREGLSLPLSLGPPGVARSDGRLTAMRKT